MNQVVLALVLSLGVAILFIFSTGASVIAQNEDFISEKILTGVAKEYDYENVGFEIEYYLSGELSNPIVIPEENSITFEYNSNRISEDELIIILPIDLIKPPITVYVDEKEEMDVTSLKAEDIIQLTIPLKENNKEITLVGVQVIPEFGSIASLILVLSIISIIVLTWKKNFLLWNGN